MTTEEENLVAYLNKNPDFLTDFISKNLPVSAQIDLAHQILALSDKNDSISGSQFLRASTGGQPDSDKFTTVLWDLAYQTMQLVDADGFHLYLSDSTGESLNLILPDEDAETRLGELCGNACRGNFCGIVL